MSMNLLFLSGASSPYVFMATIGVVLILLEAFLPGGVVGAVGVVLLAVSLMVMTNTLTGFFVSLLGVLGFTALFVYLLFKIVPKDRVKSSLFLFSSLNKSEGYSASTEKKEYLGCVGVTATILRPVGKVKFGNEILDATALTNFIEEGIMVEVVKVEGNNIIVTTRKGE